MKAKEYLDKNRIPRDARLGNNPSVYIRDLLEDYAKQEKESYLQKFRKYWNKFNARAFYITDEHIQKFKDES